MRLADLLLRLLIGKRDRDTVSGDLREEFQQGVLPSRGPVRARLWYVRQILSFMGPIACGVVIGVAFGAWTLIDTAIEPLADDSSGVMLIVFGSLLLLWALTGFAAAHRTDRLRDALVAGVLVGVTTVLVLNVAAIVRVNLFLDVIRMRTDWINLVARFEASGSPSLLSYANYEYVTGTPLLVAIGATAGALVGTLGGLVARFSPGRI